MKKFKEFQEAYGRRYDAYTRDYHSSISGMGKHQSAAYHADGGANDEGWDRDHHHKPADHPHSVHINGKKWKTFGSHSHATNVARKIKGATVHREEVEFKEHAPVAPSIGVHRISVTVSDPDHPAVTQRKETQEKFVRVTAHSKEKAIEQGKKHFAKKGWKVHDANHVGMVHEEVELDENWLVHKDGKILKAGIKQYKTAKAHAEKHGAQVNSAEWYHDNVSSKNKSVKEDIEQIDELSDTTLMNYAQKVHDDSLKHDKDPSKRSAAKRNKSVMGFSRAINKLESRPHKESTDMCNVCGQTPCNCTHIEEELTDPVRNAKQNKDIATGKKPMPMETCQALEKAEWASAVIRSA